MRSSTRTPANAPSSSDDDRTLPNARRLELSLAKKYVNLGLYKELYQRSYYTGMNGFQKCHLARILEVPIWITWLYLRVVPLVKQLTARKQAVCMSPKFNCSRQIHSNGCTELINFREEYLASAREDSGKLLDGWRGNYERTRKFLTKWYIRKFCIVLFSKMLDYTGW